MSPRKFHACFKGASRHLGELALLASLFIVGALALAGCNIVGPAAYIIEGPPKVDAAFTLADVPTVVFIDDRGNRVNPSSLRRVIGDTASQELMVRKVLTTTISPQDAMAYARQHERANQILSMEEIGKAVGAKQMIYVEMAQFSDTPDGYTPRPTAVCQVRVIDIERRQRVFPAPDSEQQAVTVQAITREVDPDLYRTRDGRLEVFEALAIETGKAIAKLFYKHEAKELGGNLNPR